MRDRWELDQLGDWDEIRLDLWQQDCRGLT